MHAPYGHLSNFKGMDLPQFFRFPSLESWQKVCRSVHACSQDILFASPLVPSLWLIRRDNRLFRWSLVRLTCDDAHRGLTPPTTHSQSLPLPLPLPLLSSIPGTILLLWRLNPSVSSSVNLYIRWNWSPLWLKPGHSSLLASVLWYCGCWFTFHASVLIFVTVIKCLTNATQGKVWGRV